MNPHRFLPLTFVALTGLAAPLAAAPLRIAVVAPQSGNFVTLGDEVRLGAKISADRLGIELALIDESCEVGSGPQVAARIREAGATAAIGFLCSESLDGALAPLKEAAIPAITLSVRWKGVMEDAIKNGWPLFRLAPTTEDEAQKLTEIILRDWTSDAIALIEDGTIHGRELADAIRNGLETHGLKPVFTDTFRPGQEQQISLVRRLRKAGVTKVFVGGDRTDISIITRDAAVEKIELGFLGGEALNAADQPVPLAEGVRAVLLPYVVGGPPQNGTSAELPREGYVQPAEAAVSILADAAALSSAMGSPLADTLVDTAFDTPIGPITFSTGHELADNPYRLMEWRKGGFIEAPPSTQ
ncbi:ABC transporter substrate-binding protein [Rhizobium daejeonense]|uniref:ABC transporter substrate-binding protein n=1 Tax=Rhizobium daejeonense TaxID=240521 RepID=A0A6M1S8J8_9HYPH|nr:ABC transporter substrate-binding protein [Rhizobium daejeonense]NGO63016.1 ABC transporter substrate-binding protein [Rhizobium daejeonense]